MKSLKHLKGMACWSNVSVVDKLDREERRQFMDMRSIFFLARNENFDVKLHQRSIILEKKSYSHAWLDRLPFPQLTMEKATTAYRLSNLYPCNILDGVNKFNSVEQAFQYTKAVTCGNVKAKARIMSLTDPCLIMEESKKLKDSYQWAKEAESVLFKFNCIKFDDPDLCEYLKSTGTQHLYAALFHPIWGCQLHLGQARNCAQDKIPGENLHGLLLEKTPKTTTKERKTRRRSRE